MKAHSNRLGILVVLGLTAGCASCLLGGCASSEPVGYQKTTTKTVNDTPTEKTTVTETREKNTTITPR